MDQQVGDRRTRVDQQLGVAGGQNLGVGEGTQDGEGVQVDADGRQPGLAHDLHDLLDHGARGGDDQDTAGALTLLVLDVGEQVQVQDRLVDGDRELVADLQGQRPAQVGLGEVGQVHLADDDLLVGEAQADVAAAEAERLPEAAQGRHDLVGLDDLAVADDAGRQGHLAEPLQGRRATPARPELDGPDRGRAQVQPDPDAHGPPSASPMTVRDACRYSCRSVRRMR